MSGAELEVFKSKFNWGAIFSKKEQLEPCSDPTVTNHIYYILGTKLHEEFSQKLQNTQRQTQASTPQPASATRRVSARSTAAAANTSTSILVPDSQMSAKPR